MKALAQLSDGRWRVTTNNSEDIVTDVVVNAAGYRAGEIMAMIGRTLPLVTMSHQYLVTEDVPELAAQTERLPLLRDPDVSYYLRQERSGFILGPYEWRAHADVGRPDTGGLLLQALERRPRAPGALYRSGDGASSPSCVCWRPPSGERPHPLFAGRQSFHCPEHGLRNFFHANAFSFGTTQAAARKALAEWVIHGGPDGIVAVGPPSLHY